MRLKLKSNYIFWIICNLLIFFMDSCEDSVTRPKNKIVIKDKEIKEKAKNEQASFDKLPDHNDSIIGYWMIDKEHSIKLSNNKDIDALVFLNTNKRLAIFDSTKDYKFEEQIGFYRFYNNKLTLEFRSKNNSSLLNWKTEIKGDRIIAESLSQKGAFLFLDRTDRSNLYE